MAELSLRHACKKFGSVQVIHDVDLEVGEGEFVVFVGPSGCGKSTLLRMIAGLEGISSGQLFIEGKEMTRTDPAKRHIAMVFQSYALYPHMSVRANLSFAPRMTGVSRSETEAKVTRVAQMLQLDNLMNRKPAQLSGGQRQRVAIGRALVRSPKVFLFDEPLSNLDAELRVQMRFELAQLHREIGKTTIYVTHDQVEAMTLADRIVVLRDGRVEQVGTPLELYDNPDNQFVGGFIGSPRMNEIEAIVDTRDDDSLCLILPGGGKAVFRLSDKSKRTGDRITLGVRPENFYPASTPEDARVSLNIEYWEHLGGMSLAYGVLVGGNRAVVQLRPDQYKSLRQTKSLSLNFAIENAFLFDSEGVRIR
ncbi:ABC-type sugar transport system ATPase subunit [Labrenzia sp. EL_126]|nr:ABC-type sugar transport system ATPase subunit [Labrenzia sp. EL_126]